jgi:hypothetical protein
MLARALGVVALAATAPVLTACGSTGARRTTTAAPGPRRSDALVRKWSRPSGVHAAPDQLAHRGGSVRSWEPLDDAGLLPRSTWAGGAPIARHMDRMRPIDRITFHHDGMDAFTDTSQHAAASRLETIRRAHLNRSPPFGDIGYHFIIDPAGRVWQGRPLDWQGAHVARQNEGNLGICLLGNYEVQQPTAAQERAIAAFLRSQMALHRVPADRVFTHRELAATKCPGRFLQPRLAAARADAGRVRV